MYIKELNITGTRGLIRNIQFKNGLNLIVDESENNVTGNNVGKTTVLKLIDFCLGKKADTIYINPENPKESYELIKDFLIENEALITLVLKEDLESPNSKEIVVERNFLSRNNKIQKINGENVTDNSEFKNSLGKVFFDKNPNEKPTFRQIISHNIRYEDLSLSNTLKTLDRYTSNATYETLYLYLLGCDFKEGEEKQEIILKLNQEINYKRRLEKFQPKTAYETRLSILLDEIDVLEERKSKLNINKNFEEDLNRLDEVKSKINHESNHISRLNIRKELILESINELEADKSEIDLDQLHLIYNQATSQIEDLQKTFNDLVNFHNRMVEEKVKFVKKELPELEKDIKNRQIIMSNLLEKERELANLISKSDSFMELEDLINELNEKYRNKGEIENTIEQIDEVEASISKYEDDLSKIDEKIFSDDFESLVRTQVDKFNKYFSRISNYLYGEKYALNYTIETNRKGQKLYKFSSFNTNLSTGKKQGEISSFDIAYILFAEDEGMEPIRFLLNDKKELMDDNQLVRIRDLVEENDIQFIASILKDKLPPELDKEEYFIIKLSDTDKLFRIESM
jgi:uncharacterized protein YydD (DUF2326 family)